MTPVLLPDGPATRMRIARALPGCLVTAVLLFGCRAPSDVLSVAGTIEVREVSIAPLTPGRIARVVPEEGDTVRRGDTIAVIVQPGLDDRVAEAEARHAAALARVADLESGARPEELEAARATLQAAVADSLWAGNEYGRIRGLFDDGITTPAQLDAASTTAATAAARALQAREALNLVIAGPRALQIGAARREAEAFASAVAALESQRRDLVLTAPTSGILLLRLAEPGEVAAPGVPVAVLGVTGDPWVRAFVGYDRIARVTRGAEVRVRVAAYPDAVFPGIVSYIAPEAEFVPRAALTERERADLVFAIRVSLDDAGGRLKPGMPVDLEIEMAPPP